MSAARLFIVGFLVTLIVTAALALLIYAAILDGRDAAAQKARGEQESLRATATRRAAGSRHNDQRSRHAEEHRRDRQGRGTFTTLMAALDRSGLEDAGRRGPYTVFAPSDEAFAQLPDGAVDSLLASPENSPRS